MKKIILIAAGVLLSAGAVFSQTTPEERADVKSSRAAKRIQREADFHEAYLSHRNAVGVRKLLVWGFMLNDNDSDFSSYRINDFGIYYSRLLGKRWHIGGGYYQATESFMNKETFFPLEELSSGSRPLSGGAQGLLSATRGSQHLRLLLGLDILQKRFLIIRISALLSILASTWQQPGILPDTESGKGSIDLSKLTGFDETTSRFNEFPYLSLGLDFLYPIKYKGLVHEVGISTQIVPGNNPKLGISGCFNFRF